MRQSPQLMFLMFLGLLVSTNSLEASIQYHFIEFGTGDEIATLLFPGPLGEPDDAEFEFTAVAMPVVGILAGGVWDGLQGNTPVVADGIGGLTGTRASGFTDWGEIRSPDPTLRDELNLTFHPPHAFDSIDFVTSGVAGDEWAFHSFVGHWRTPAASPVPEPSAIVIWGVLGALCLAGRRYRSKRSI